MGFSAGWSKAPWAWFAAQGEADPDRRGYTYPAAVKAATEGYRSDMDVVGQFIDDCCVRDLTAKVATAELYGAWKVWAAEVGEYPMSQKMLSPRLEEKGFTRHRSNGIWFHGLRVHPSRSPRPY